MKRILSLLLSLVLLAAVLPVPHAQAAINMSEYYELSEKFIQDSRWADGTYWDRNHKQTASISDWSSLGCCAYAADFAGYVYGSRRAWNTSEFTKHSDQSKITAGDIVHYHYTSPKYSSEHWIVVLDRDGDSLYTAEANVYSGGQYSRVLVTKSKWIIKDGKLKSQVSNEEYYYDFEIFSYKFSDKAPEGPYVCDHSAQETVNVAAATCEAPGYSGDIVCAKCREVLETGKTVAMLGHNWSGFTCKNCGSQSANVYRLGGETRFDTAIQVANELKTTLGVKKFPTIVIASGTGFADALAGSYLAAVLEAPILLSYSGGPINDKIAAYVKENLEEDGLVYILGGENAVPESLAESLAGCNVRRLAGPDRFATNLEILDEAGVGTNPILVCTAANFADSLSASAAGLPILLVGNTLTADQKAFLDEAGSNGFYIIGGTSAVSQAMEEALSGYGKVQRLAGQDRLETSVKIAKTFFPQAEAAVLAYAWNYPDGLCGGALASAMGAPLLLTMNGRTGEAGAFVQKNSMTRGYVLGSRNLISDASARTVFNLNPSLAIQER